jgi:hypothetical protein
MAILATEKVLTLDYWKMAGDLQVGDIVFNPKNNKKFEAYSDFFDWNNIKFYDG